MSSGQIAVATPSNRIKRRRPQYTLEKKMKLSLKQKIRNWLMNDQANDFESVSLAIEDSYPSIDSNGFRLQVYKANGGVVVETKRYDMRKDEDRNSLYVITEDKDLGEEIGKIITMENLRG
jgi:hypothetical protein